MLRMRRAAAPLIMSAVVALGACSSNTADTTTTAPVEQDVAQRQMCRTLELLEAARVSGSTAAVALETVDLAEADGPTRSAYGDLLIGAPTTHCPSSAPYAENVAYWLGF